MLQVRFPSFYITNGVLPADADSYVVRQADTELAEALRNAEFCYVLNTRQMGKSSLMVRTANHLRQQGIAVVGLDISSVGKNLSPDQWYDGLLAMLAEQLHLEAELEAFWHRNGRLGPMQRFMAALQQVVLAQVPGPIVVFVDEIDAVRSLPFSADEFFTGIRECYNRRALDPEFGRLTFCLMGVATPADLVADVRLSPFNIGRRISLHDFTPEQASALTRGLLSGTTVTEDAAQIRTGKALLNRVLYWTSGHPYMTQRLCQAIAETTGTVTPQTVDSLCARLFFSKAARETDDNLAFARNLLLGSREDIASVLDLYQRVWRGRYVSADEMNPVTSVLKLSGVVRDEAGRLTIRNRVYRTVFDRNWVQAHMPDAEVQRQRIAYRRGMVGASIVVGILALVVGALLWFALQPKHSAEGSGLPTPSHASRSLPRRSISQFNSPPASERQAFPLTAR